MGQWAKEKVEDVVGTVKDKIGAGGWRAGVLPPIPPTPSTPPQGCLPHLPRVPWPGVLHRRWQQAAPPPLRCTHQQRATTHRGLPAGSGMDQAPLRAAPAGLAGATHTLLRRAGLLQSGAGPRWRRLRCASRGPMRRSSMSGFTSE